MRTMTEAELTERVVEAFAGTPDPRLREVLTRLVRHLHAFVVEVGLTEAEWLAAIEFLTETGKTCTDQRQEFILLSDVLGVSSLVDLVGHGKPPGATESTILGPFYVPGAPERALGATIALADNGDPALVRGQVTDLDGQPLAGALLDVWQTSSNGLYDVQDPSQPKSNLRGRFHTGADGRYEFWTVTPVSYQIPSDGPVGELLRVTARHPWRAAHIHVIVSADGYEPVTTHIFDQANEYLESDAVFGVKDSLVYEFTRHEPGHEGIWPPGDPERPFYVVTCDFALQPGRSVTAD
jgi:protocatechuate 3,4-dioxygenase beta subunit